MDDTAPANSFLLTASQQALTFAGSLDTAFSALMKLINNEDLYGNLPDPMTRRGNSSNPAAPSTTTSGLVVGQSYQGPGAVMYTLQASGLWQKTTKALGGPGTSFIAGEMGPELVVAPGGAYVYTAAQTAGMATASAPHFAGGGEFPGMGGSSPVELGPTTIRQLADILVSALERSNVGR